MQLLNHRFEKVLEKSSYGMFIFAGHILDQDKLEIHYMNQTLIDLLGVEDPMVGKFPKLYITGLIGDKLKEYTKLEKQLIKNTSKAFTFQSKQLKATYSLYTISLLGDYKLCVVAEADTEVLDNPYKAVTKAVSEILPELKDALETYINRFKQAQSVANIGSFEYIPGTKKLWISDEMKRIFGVEGRDIEVFRTDITKIVHDEDLMTYRKFIEQFGPTMMEPTNLNFRVYHGKTYELRYIHAEADPKWSSEGKLLCIRGIVRDFTDRELYEQMLVQKNENITNLYEELLNKQKLLEKQISETQYHKNKFYLSEEKYRTLVNNSQDVIYSCDIKGKIMAVNQRFCELFDITVDSAIGMTYKDIVNDSLHYNQWHDAFTVCNKEKKAITIEQSYRDAGEKRIYDMTFSPIKDDMNHVIGITITKHNITLIRENENQLKHLTMHDALTDLPNRAALYDKLNHLTEEDEDNELSMALLFIDMDNFKKVNDTLGHSTGDKLLKAVSRRIASCLRAKDFIARLSGDEFAILLAGIDTPDDISIVIHRILKRVNETFSIENHKLDVTASIGIACYPQDAVNTEELMKCADTAMYRSKDTSKNNYQFYNETMRELLISKVRYEQSLKQAIQANELYLMYQPQFKADGSLRGFEALVRWESMTFGFVGPDQFIPVAEETGLIHELGGWVVKTAVTQCKLWQEAQNFEGVMAINISPIQLQRASFVDFIKNTIQDIQVGHQQIELEVTESLFIDNYDMAINVLDGLKDSGFRIALDDFGTGYSSLSYLKRLPINLLKIDKSFVSEIDVEDPEGNITESIISLVHKLNIETVAEGVETAEQMDYLVKAKCDNLQGYHLGRPLSVEDATALLEKYNKQ